MSSRSDKDWITASDLANYVVCPEAWRLKWSGAGERQENERTAESQEKRAEWVQKQDLSSALRKYSRVTYVMLFLLAILVFVLEVHRGDYLKNVSRANQGGSDQFNVPTEIAMLMLLLGVVIFLWDLFERRRRKISTETGTKEASEAIAVKGSSTLPAKLYSAESIGLRGKPDAVFRENGQIIPMSIHPLTSKIRDRHVVQMLAYLRLVEEAENIRPDYGVLLMGKGQRRVQLKNAPEKQVWLDTLIDEMRSIMDGVPAIPAPSPPKCRTCDVRDICTFSQANESRPGGKRKFTIAGDQEEEDL